MKERDIITLDNNAEYLLLDEIEYEDKKYFFSVGFSNNNVDYSDYIFLETGIDNNGEYVEKVCDEKLYKALLVIELTREVTDNVPELKAQLEEEINNYNAY